MGDWYLIPLGDLLGVDETSTQVEMKKGILAPKYSSIWDENLDSFGKHYIDRILIKQTDAQGRKFKEVSSALAIGSTMGPEPLAVDMLGRKAAGNEEIVEYISHMQEVCGVAITRFDILNQELKSAYELYKPVLNRVMQSMRFAKLKSAGHSKLLGFISAGKAVMLDGQTRPVLTLSKDNENA